MTAEQVINAWLAERYVGKQILAPSPNPPYEPEPFAVVETYYDQDYDHVSIWFWGPEVGAGERRRALNLSFGAELPEVLP